MEHNIQSMPARNERIAYLQLLNNDETSSLDAWKVNNVNKIRVMLIYLCVQIKSQGVNK